MVSHPELVAANDVTNRLLDATSELVLQGGPRAATVSAVAARAGMSRMTVYRKFGDRHSLLSALFNRELDAVFDSAPVGDPTPERIAQVVVNVVDAINSHPLMDAVLRHEPEQLTEWITVRLGRTQRRAKAVLKTLISAGQTTGSVRPGDSDEMALTLVLVAQAFVFGHRIASPTTQLHALVKGYLDDPSR